MAMTQRGTGDAIWNGLDEVLEKAKRALAEAKEDRPRELESQVGTAEVAVVHLRDHLIDSMRKQTGTAGPHIKAALGHANVALSLVVGIEYPLSGIKRTMIDEAEKVLSRITIPDVC